MSASQSHIPKPPTTARRRSLPLLLNALGLTLVAVWLRVCSLGNIPGLNGDEAWYGVRAWQLLHGTADGGWHTPTGNPINPLFLGPLSLLLVWFPPSIELLRSVALAGGLAALAVNWLCCRWVFDRRTALISTVALAVLPINIAYSRFAWDASQSLAATLLATYLALAAVRFPDRSGRWTAAAMLALTIAIWVHPTNIFVGAVIAMAFARRCLEARESRDRALRLRDICAVGPCDDEDAGSETVTRKTSSPVARISCYVMLLAAVLIMAVWGWNANPARGPLPGRIAQWWSNVLDLPCVAVSFARLFTGGTIYRYIAGSRSWFEWPLPAGSDGWGLDVGLFWAGLFGSVWMLGRSWQREHRSRLGDGKDGRLQLLASADGVLLAAWVLEFVAFQLVAGAGAMTPGLERFSLCLIGPTVLLGVRGAALAWEAASTRGRVGLTVAAVAGWALLADFDVHYFRFIEQTGGQAHLTFRTAAVEPKLAALSYVLREAAGNDCFDPSQQESRAEAPASEENGGKSARIWIVCSEWWNLWSIRYLAVSHPGVCVVGPAEIGASDDYRRALAEGRVWFVEFYGSDALRRVESQLAGRQPTRKEFLDYAGRPVLCVLHALTE